MYYLNLVQNYAPSTVGFDQQKHEIGNLDSLEP